MHALSEVLDVAAVQTSHGDAAIGSHVHVSLFSESLGLWLSKTSEAGIKILVHADSHAD